MAKRYFYKILQYTIIISLFTISAFAHDYLFIENKGQWEANILFKSSIPGGNLLITKYGLTYEFYDTKSLYAIHHHNLKSEQSSRSTQSEIKQVQVGVRFLNNASFANIESQKQAEQQFNYFLGNDKSKWTTNVKSYKELLIKDLYPKIDFRIYVINEVLKYEYIVKKGGNPNLIQLTYEGLKKMELASEKVIFSTEINVFQEINPFSFQKIDNKTKSIKTDFQLDNSTISFKIADYNKNETLVIDPELVFSSYSGASSDNWSHTATYDLKGNLYAGGSIFGSGFPVTSNVVQNHAGGTSSVSTALITDMVIIKFSADGSKILYATFLGGNMSEVPHSLIVNSRNELVIYGTTSSTDFPTTSTAFSQKFGGGLPIRGEPITTSIAYPNGSDCFVTVISENGDKLIGSTYIGGTGNEGIHDTRFTPIRNYGDEFRSEVYVDASNKIYVGTVTNSNDFPIINGNKTKGSTHDAIVFRLNEDASKLEFSSYLGGTEYDAINGIRATKNGEIYVTGVTVSKDLGTPNVYENKFQGDSDGFIALYSNDKLSKFTYLGTNRGDACLFIDIDNDENVYVMGLSLGNYPITNGVYRNEKSGQFIHSLDKTLTKSNFSTTYGSQRGIGTIDVVPTAFMINECGNIYVAAWGGRVNVTTGLNAQSSTANLPITSDAYQQTTTGSNYHILILEKNAKSLLLGTYFGSSAPTNPSEERGDHLDGGTCRFDKSGIIYHSACVCKSSTTGFVSFPVKNAVYSQHNHTNCNMAAFKFDIGALKANFELKYENKPVDIACNPSKINFVNTSKNAKSYEWFVDGQLVSRFTNPEYTFEKAGKFKVKLVAYNTTQCIATDSLEREIIIKDFPTTISRDTTICAGKTVMLTASGGNLYNWTPGNQLSNTTSNSTIATVNTTTNFTVTISDSVCSTKRHVTVRIENEKPDFVVTPSKEVCKGDTVSIEASGLFEKLVWQSENFKDSLNTKITLSPLQSTSYSAIATYQDGCRFTKQVNLKIDESYKPNFTHELAYDCFTKPTINLNAISSNATNYIWQIGNKIIENSTKIEQLSFEKSGNYNIKLIAENAIGCRLETQKSINFTAYDGIIPNIITPNGDNINDTFSIGFPIQSVDIYNRWGKNVLHSTEYLNDWSSAQVGTYFYVILLQNGQSCKGYFDVIE